MTVRQRIDRFSKSVVQLNLSIAKNLSTPILARLQVGMGAKHFPTRSSYESTLLEFATLKKTRCVILASETHMFPRKLTWETSR